MGRSRSITASIAASLLIAIVGIGGVLLGAAMKAKPHPLIPALPPIGNAFEGVVGLAPDEIRAELDKAKASLESHHELARSYCKWSEIVSWIGFGITSLISVIAGFLGMAPSSSTEAKAVVEHLREEEEERTKVAGIHASSTKAAEGNRTSRLSPRLMIVGVAVLAALASMVTGIANKLSSDADRHQKAALGLHEAYSIARKDLFNATTAVDARRALDQLGAAVLRQP